MNFVGVDVAGLDVAAFLAGGQVVYLCLYASWVLWVLRGRHRWWVWGPSALALVCWFLATFPLQRLYGLASTTDRMRNLWWCAAAAAGRPFWESGVLDGMSFEPAWSFLVSSLALRDPARVSVVYPFLPVLAILLVGGGLVLSALVILPDDALEGRFPGERSRLALWLSFFVLLASTGPVDFLNPYRGFWMKTFLLKPNHALGLAVVPVSVLMLSRATSWRRSMVIGALLGLLGWLFITYWALTCWGIFLYAVWTFATGTRGRGESLRGVVALTVGLVLVLPYLYFLIRQFPATVSFEAGGFADDPLRSVWGESPPRAQSLFFLSTFDLGANFYLALYALWTSLARGTRFDRLSVSLVVGAYSAWAVNGLLLFTGRARQSDEIYYFLVFVVAVEAALGLHRIIERGSAIMGKLDLKKLALFREPRALTAVALGLWFPLSLGWWWNPLLMDAHFRMGLEPVPPGVVEIRDWILENTRETDVFLVGAEPALWIPALTGRRILFEDNPERVAEAMDRRALTYVVLAPPSAADELETASLVEKREELRDLLEAKAKLTRVFAVGSVNLYSVRYPPG